MGYVNSNHSRVAVPNFVRVIRVRVGLRYRSLCMSWLRTRIAKIESRVTRGVDQDSDSFRRHVKRHRRMRIACIHLRIGVDARHLLLTALRVRHQLQSESVDLFSWAQRQLDHATSRQSLAFI